MTSFDEMRIKLGAGRIENFDFLKAATTKKSLSLTSRAKIR